MASSERDQTFIATIDQRRVELQMAVMDYLPAEIGFTSLPLHRTPVYDPKAALNNSDLEIPAPAQHRQALAGVAAARSRE